MFVERVLEEMTLAMERGEQVKISSFGTFSVRSKSMRMGRNPKTGEEVAITPRRVITFRASHVLKDRINEVHRDKSSQMGQFICWPLGAGDLITSHEGEMHVDPAC